MIVALNMQVRYRLLTTVLASNFWEPGTPKPAHIYGRYGLTFNVDPREWGQWLDRNCGSALVREKLILAAETMDEIKALIIENGGGRSGLEGVPRT